MPRVSKPTVDRVERIREPFLAALLVGASMAEASRTVGVPERTVQNWVSRGGREPGSVFASFAGQVHAAREDVRSGPLDLTELADVVARAARGGSVQAMKLAHEMLRAEQHPAVKPAGSLSALDELAAGASWSAGAGCGMTVVDRAVNELDLFAEFCGGLRVESGAPMVLESFQRTILTDYFDGAHESLVLLPKKLGKSTLLAALALYVALTHPDGEILIAAASRDQASFMLRQAAGFVRRSEELRSRLTVKQREIENPDLGTRIRVAASDCDTLDGWLGDACFCDELHRHRSPDLYQILRTGLIPRGGRMVTISTAGDSELSPLGVLRTRAYQLRIQRRDGVYKYAASADRSFVMHEWSLDEAEDAEDLALMKRANPASWMTLERLRERHDSPSQTTWGWRRFAAGQWVMGEHTAVEPADWDACADAMAFIPPRSPIYVGLDLAWRGPDTTALLPLWWKSPDRRVVGDPTVLVAPEGGTLDDRSIFAAMRALRDRYRIVGVAYDPNAGGQAVCQQISRELGLEMIEHSQRDSAMALADGRLLEAIRRRELVHTGHEILRQHVLNAVEKSVQGDRFRFTRPRHGARRPTDCLTALSMAHSVAVSEAEKPPKPSNEWYMVDHF